MNRIRRAKRRVPIIEITGEKAMESALNIGAIELLKTAAEVGDMNKRHEKIPSKTSDLSRRNARE